MKMEKVTTSSAKKETANAVDPRSLHPQDFNLDDYYGLLPTYGGKPILPLSSATGDSVTNHLDSGYTQDVGSDGIITYTFAVSNHITGLYNNKHYGLPDSGNGYSPFTAEQKEAGRAAIQLWDDLIPQTFVEQKGLGNADITLANSLNPGQAYAFYPYFEKPGINYPGDVFVRDPATNASNMQFGYGDYGPTTIIHELGHTLGLSHPGAYNGTGTFSTDAEYAQDTNQYSIMSYFNGTYSGQLALNWNMGGVGLVGPYNPTTGTYSFSFYANYSQGPQLHDIFVIQEKYGADMTTRADATTYGFNSNAGNALFDFNANPFPNYSIYDAGGNDTIDASGFTISQMINLTPGSFSSIGGSVPDASVVNDYWHDYYADYGLPWNPAWDYTNAELASLQDVARLSVEYRIFNETGVHGIYANQHDNVSIAYNTIIENAIGGSARDLIIGNDADNRLEGRGGNDVIDGGNGDDIIIGGLGADTLTGGEGHDTFLFDHVQIGDLITDFGADDVIDLSQLGDDLSYIGQMAFTGHAGEVNYMNGVLGYDANGDATADFTVTLSGMPEINVDQLVLHA